MHSATGWPEAELIGPSGLISDGRDAIIRGHQEFWAATGDTKAFTSVRPVRPLSPTLMVVDITARISGFPGPPPGCIAAANGDVYSNLKHAAERRGDDWKILVSQNTCLPPP